MKNTRLLNTMKLEQIAKSFGARQRGMVFAIAWLLCKRRVPLTKICDLLHLNDTPEIRKVIKEFCS